MQQASSSAATNLISKQSLKKKWKDKRTLHYKGNEKKKKKLFHEKHLHFMV